MEIFFWIIWTCSDEPHSVNIQNINICGERHLYWYSLSPLHQTACSQHSNPQIWHFWQILIVCTRWVLSTGHNQSIEIRAAQVDQWYLQDTPLLLFLLWLRWSWMITHISPGFSFLKSSSVLLWLGPASQSRLTWNNQEIIKKQSIG